MRPTQAGSPPCAPEREAEEARVAKALEDLDEAFGSFSEARAETSEQLENTSCNTHALDRGRRDDRRRLALIKRYQTHMVLLFAGLVLLLCAAGLTDASFLPKGVKPSGFFLSTSSTP